MYLLAKNLETFFETKEIIADYLTEIFHFLLEHFIFFRWVTHIKIIRILLIMLSSANCTTNELSSFDPFPHPSKSEEESIV